MPPIKDSGDKKSKEGSSKPPKLEPECKLDRVRGK